MMTKTLQLIMLRLHKYFKVIWFFVTIFSVIISFFITLKLSEKHLNTEVINSARDTTKNFDGFIEDLFQEVYTLPLYGKNISICNVELYNSLERIILNNPKISGLVITNSQHLIICSTIPVNDLTPWSTPHSRTLLGPFKAQLFDQPTYILQQIIGPYTIDIIIVASVVQEELEMPTTISNSIILYDQINDEQLINLKHSDDHKNWIINTNNSPKSTHFVTDRLHSIDGLVLRTYPNKAKILDDLWTNEFFSLLLTLLIIYSLYTLLDRRISYHFSIHRELKFALKNKSFYPEYQPIYDCINQRFSGVEVLLRLKSPEGKEVMPDTFIQEAESNGLIVPITIQIIEITFEDFHTLLKEYPYVHLSINLSVSHFKNERFFDSFELLRKQYNIPTQQIILEITERDLLDKHDRLFSDRMNALREQGFSLAIDDFGTGHASISYLQSFPFNYLKIDKIFVQAIGTKAITESLNDAIIQLGTSLGLTIIAEGVETIEQVNYLKNNGVCYLQGWYYSKAVPITTINRLLQGIHDD